MSGTKNTREKKVDLTSSAFRERYRKELAKRPLVSDEEFMAETEVSDEQYAMGFTLLLADGEDEVIDEQD
jgi:hypothetical protein